MSPISDQPFRLFDPQTSNTHQKENYSIDCQAIEAALRKHPSVEDCVVLIHSDRSGQQAIAYVVANGPFQPIQLHDHLRAILPHQSLSISYVPVAALPLTEEGKIDLPALSCLPVIDEHQQERQFKPPSLRNVTQRGLFMHAGSVCHPGRGAPSLQHCT